MAKTPAERVKDYQSKCDAIMLRPYKDEGSRIRQAAAAAGQSVQAYILDAIRAKMQKAGE